MKPIDYLTQTVRSLRSRSLESALIVFAIALGVGVVTAMLALILNGFEQERSITQSIEARELSLVARESNYQAFNSATGFNPVFKLGKVSDKPAKLEKTDLQVVLAACPSLKYAYLNDFDALSEYPNKDDPSRVSEVRVRGVTQSYIEAAKLNLLAGAWPTGKEFAGYYTLIAISEHFARERFGPKKKIGSSEDRLINSANDTTPEKPFDVKNALNKILTSRNTSDFRVVAVFAPPKYDSTFATDQNPDGAQGIIPWGSTNFGRNEVFELKFLAQEDQFDAAREQLRTYVDRRFGSAIASNAAIDAITSSLNVSRNAALITALFASGGLVIAALNITNLMLARVLSRTRTIGISSALGASSRTLFLVFLTESLMLGLLGGALGLGLARGITAGLEFALRGAGSNAVAAVNLNLLPLHFALGFAVALCVSFLFGVYPAWMASRIRPSEALRG